MQWLHLQMDNLYSLADYCVAWAGCHAELVEARA
jgi:hypothetical protein